MHDTYDVFLSHDVADEPVVEGIAVRLQGAAGIRPFLCKWYVMPGEPWIAAIERAIDSSRVVAVFLGPQGTSAWYREQVQLALASSTGRSDRRVMPVLLGGARVRDVGGFLGLRTPIDLAGNDGFIRLVAGILGRPPGASQTV
jgi:hypothetical protein